MLSAEEISLLKDAHAYITVLIAGADGNIDADELSWADKIAQNALKISMRPLTRSCMKRSSN